MKKKRSNMMMKFEPNQSANKYTFYLYDDVTKDGSFDWSTWEYVESKTSAKYFADQLAQIPANAEIEIFINSNGGSVSEGTAIYNQLKRHPAHKTGYVDGCAYSVASLILQACDKRIMGLGTSMLVHNMWVYTAGNAQMLRSMADDLDHWMEANRKIYLEHSNGKIQESELMAVMDGEKILTPDDALAYGFIDEIDSDSELEGADEGIKPVQLAQIQTMQDFISARQKLMRSIKQLKDDEDEDSTEDDAADEKPDEEESADKDSEDEDSEDEDSGDRDSTEDDSEKDNDDEATQSRKLEVCQAFFSRFF